MTSRLQRHATATEFLRVAESALEQDEAANNLILGIAARLRQQEATRVPLSPAPYLATVSDENHLVAAGLITPPHNLVLFAQPDAATVAFDTIADDLLHSDWSVTGVIGLAPIADAFRDLWLRKAGAQVNHTVRERIYVLTNVIAPRPAAGHFRVCTPDDEAMLVQWARAFQAEALHADMTVEAAQNLVRPRIAAGDLFVWDHNGPVCCASRARATKTGISIGLVYTPPQYRQHGYASALVAALSEHCLDAGRRFCMLFTDLANPTSNRIYQKIGYRPVCDVNEYRFASA